MRQFTKGVGILCVALAFCALVVTLVGVLGGLSSPAVAEEAKATAHPSSLSLQGKECDRAGITAVAMKGFNGLWVSSPADIRQAATIQCDKNLGPCIALYDGKSPDGVGNAHNLAFLLQDGVPTIQVVTSKGKVRVVKVEDLLPPEKK